MKFKKVLLGLTAAASVAAPVATTVACGGTSAFKEVTELPKAAWNGQNVFLALDGSDHSADDKSFNQQGREGIEAFTGVTPLPAAKIIKPAGATNDAFKQMYASADKNSVIVAPGFLHIDPLIHSAEEIANKSIILLDGSDHKSNIISVEFKVEQAAFLAGYAFAKYASTDAWSQLSGNDGKLVVSTFGGMNIPTVTGFMAGFRDGFKKALDAIKTTLNYKNGVFKNVDSVSFFEFGTKSEQFSGGFAAGGGKAVVDKLKAQGVDVVLPVAGPQTKDVLDAGLKAIGVDTAQENQYTSDVLFSILKNLKDSTTRALKVIKGDASVAQADKDLFKFGETAFGDLDNKLVGISAKDDANNANDVYSLYEAAKADTATLALAKTQSTNW